MDCYFEIIQDFVRMNVNWNYPTAVRTGPGRISKLADTYKELGMRNPLLVTDPGLGV
jgi:alcohol dehydrogenase class IV